MSILAIRKTATGLMVLMLVGCTVGLAPAVEPARPPSQPMDVRIISAPEQTSESGLVRGTWWLVGATFALCIATVIHTWRQSREMGASIRIAGQTAEAAGRAADAANSSAERAARETRNGLERETNVAAHRVAVMATLVGQMAEKMLTAHAQLLVFAGQNGVIHDDDPVRIKKDEHVKRVKEVADVALTVASARLSDWSDGDLLGKLKRFDEYLVQLEATKEEISTRLAGIAEESRIIRENRAHMQAAALNAQMSRAPKTKLGD